MVELWLTRHGETEYNTKRIVQGVVNSNLTERGAADAQALGRGFAKLDVHFDATFVSDLQRTSDTAQLALTAANIKLPITKVPGLRELNFGMFEGNPESQRQDALAGLLENAGVQNVNTFNMKQMVNLVRVLDVHNGNSTAENGTMSVKRFSNALIKIAQDAEAAGQERIFIVAHGAVIWLLLNTLGMPENYHSIRNVAVSKVIYGQGKLTMASYDDRKYVEAGGGRKI